MIDRFDIENFDMCDFGSSGYYIAQGTAWKMMDLLGSLHGTEKLSIENLITLIACYALNFTHENGICRLKLADRTDIEGCVLKFGINANDTLDALVEQGHLINIRQGYIVICHQLMNAMLHLSSPAQIQPSAAH